MKKGKLMALVAGVLCLAVTGALTYAWFIQRPENIWDDGPITIDATTLEVKQALKITAETENLWAGDIIPVDAWSITNLTPRNVVVRVALEDISGTYGQDSPDGSIEAGDAYQADRLNQVLQVAIDEDGIDWSDPDIEGVLDIVPSPDPDENAYYLRLAPDAWVFGGDAIKIRLTSDFGGNHIAYTDIDGNVVAEGFSGGDDYPHEQGSHFEFTYDVMAIQNTYEAVWEIWGPEVADALGAQGSNVWG